MDIECEMSKLLVDLWFLPSSQAQYIRGRRRQGISSLFNHTWQQHDFDFFSISSCGDVHVNVPTKQVTKMVVRAIFYEDWFKKKMQCTRGIDTSYLLWHESVSTIYSKHFFMFPSSLHNIRAHDPSIFFFFMFSYCFQRQCVCNNGRSRLEYRFSPPMEGQLTHVSLFLNRLRF